MEGEINNFILVWSTVLVSLYYCHTIGKIFPEGNRRKFAIIPVACLFFYLPLNLNTIHLGGTTSFFIAWLGSFKLILFAFGKGPLSSDPPLPLSRFISLACLPIKAQQTPESTKENQKSPLNYVTKLMLLVMCMRMYEYTQFLHPKIIWFVYGLHIYFALEMLLAVLGAIAKASVKVELEPQFNEPYLSTSVQDFWGRRWNLMVTNILRPTVYDPVRSIFEPLMGRRLAALPAIVATFLVSGLMHELVFYNIGRVRPTGEVTCFFLLHGVFVAAEIVVKRALRGKFWLPGIISAPLTLVFVVFTSFWLFFPPFLMNKSDVKACTESLAIIEFVKHGSLVNPNGLTCPYF